MSETAPAPRPTRRFQRANGPRLTPDEMRRQGELATRAWLHFGERDAAVAFMNASHPDLDGRPIDLAVASDDGLARATAVLTATVRV